MITPFLRGRLGNQMFQYAITRLIAEKKGYNFYFPKEKNGNGQNISDYFDLDTGVVDGTIRYNYEENPNQNYDPNLFNVYDFTLISGFFQTEKYFLGYEEKLKEWFKINKTNEVENILNKYPTDEYCYIHFRGGDYKDMPNWLLPKKYYEDAINKMKEINSTLKFLVITDDVELASQFFNDFEIMSNDMMVDFSLLYYAKFCIIPNSSFSWWAAWLSDKEKTIAPLGWINYNKKDGTFWPSDVKTNKFLYV
jgi:hypothetical protein